MLSFPAGVPRERGQQHPVRQLLHAAHQGSVHPAVPTGVQEALHPQDGAAGLRAHRWDLHSPQPAPNLATPDRACFVPPQVALGQPEFIHSLSSFLSKLQNQQHLAQLRGDGHLQWDRNSSNCVVLTQ